MLLVRVIQSQPADSGMGGGLAGEAGEAWVDGRGQQGWQEPQLRQMNVVGKTKVGGWVKSSGDAFME